MTIAVIDTGIDVDSPEFAGRLSPASIDIYPDRNQLEGPDDHGTSVALVAAAARDNAGILGMAWEADVLAIRTDEPGTCGGDNPEDPRTECLFLDSDIAAAVDHSVANGAKVINISLGGDDGSSIELRQAIVDAANAGVLVVLAAGNAGLDRLESFASQLSGVASGGVIVVGSVDSEYRISDFSNRPGSETEYYLAARGEAICCAYEDGEIYFDDEGFFYLLSGTSFAAPQVAGAAALLAQAFPHLTGREIAEILLRTAFDAGVPGDDAVYGRGILNIQAAFQPIGATALAGTGAAISSAQVNMTASPAMGDALTGLSLPALITDEYRRAFATDLGGTVQSAGQRSPLHGALARDSRYLSAGSTRTAVAFSVDARDRAAPSAGILRLDPKDVRQARVLAARVATQLSPDTQFGFAFAQGADGLVAQMQGQDRPAFMIAGGATGDAGSHQFTDISFALRQRVGKWGIAVSGETGETYSSATFRRDSELRGHRSERGVSTITLGADRLFGDLETALGLSWTSERGSLLGAHFNEGFGLAGADSLFLDMSAGWTMSRNWRLGASFRQGWTNARSGGLVESGSNLMSRGFSVDLARRNVVLSGDRLALRVSQPLRVESGQLNLALPESFDYSTFTAGFAAHRIALTPSGRELNAELAWQGKVASGNAMASLFYRREPGHFEDMPDDAGVALRWSRSF